MLPKANFPAPLIKFLFFPSGRRAIYAVLDYAEAFVQDKSDRCDESVIDVG